VIDEIIVAGSGGQGIQFLGQLLARAAVEQGLEATYVPAYGAERRGGPSVCSVVVADHAIYTPVFAHPDIFLAFDQRGRNQYGASIKKTGIIIANENLASQAANGEQAKVISVPASKLAEQVSKEIKPFNLVLLGAYIALGRGVHYEVLQERLKVRLANKPELYEVNALALQKGFKCVQENKS
jgi:2-oxoglutarate ferredoxin oxidoreductase subunit gamma